MLVLKFVKFVSILINLNLITRLIRKSYNKSVGTGVIYVIQLFVAEFVRGIFFFFSQSRIAPSSITFELMNYCEFLIAHIY